MRFLWNWVESYMRILLGRNKIRPYFSNIRVVMSAFGCFVDYFFLKKALSDFTRRLTLTNDEIRPTPTLIGRAISGSRQTRIAHRNATGNEIMKPAKNNPLLMRVGLIQAGLCMS